MHDYPIQPGKWRFTLKLEHPRQLLRSVPIERNPHSGFDGWTCFYECADWSTIFGVEDYGDSIKCVIESGNPEPIWGERIVLYSTSSCIVEEPWGTNRANKFAYFRGFYWRITQDLFHHDWHEMHRLMGGRVVYPIRNEDEPIIYISHHHDYMNRYMGILAGYESEGIFKINPLHNWTTDGF